jgi:laccase
MFPLCSRDDTFKVAVQQGNTYLLRVINTGLTNDMFFAIAGHCLTVVSIDARYTKPLTVDYIMIAPGHYIMIAPGQTMDVLLEANFTLGSNSRYYMATRAFITLPVDTIPFNNSTVTAIVEYTDSPRRGHPGHQNSLSSCWPSRTRTQRWRSSRSSGR